MISIIFLNLWHLLKGWQSSRMNTTNFTRPSASATSLLRFWTRHLYPKWSI